MTRAKTIQPAYVYMMRCENGALYTGWTNDLLRRMKAHTSGKGAKYTKGFGGVQLVYAEMAQNKSQALQREAALKKATKEQKEALVAQFDAASFVIIQPATPADAQAVHDVFDYYVHHSTASFLYETPSVEHYRKEIRTTGKKLPFLVARNANGEVLGYTCAHPWRYGTGAYAWDTETTIYLAPNARRLGVGRMLYQALLAALKEQGYWNAYAVLADPNPASEAFHESFGFVCEGRQKRTGWKQGWQGVSYWLLDLCPQANSEPEQLPTELPKGRLAEIAAAARLGYTWQQICDGYSPEE